MTEALNEDSDRAEAVRKRKALADRINAMCGGKQPHAVFLCSGKDTKEQELIRRFGQGDQEAFEAFHGIFFPRLARHYFSRYSRYSRLAWANQERAEDKANDMLFSAYCKADSYRPGMDVWRWLLTFGKTRMVWVGKQAKTRYFMGAGSEDSLDSEHPCLTREPKPAPVPNLSTNTIQAVNTILAAMNPRHVDALRLLANNNGFTTKELGACLGRADDSGAPLGADSYYMLVQQARRAFCQRFARMVEAERNERN